METFHEMYFDEKVDFKGDCLDAMEYRHDWASFRFTLSLFKFFFTGMLPEVIMHTRSQGSPITTCVGNGTADLVFQTKSKSATITTAATTFTAGFLVLV